jgi:hypothetical protein
LEKDSLTDPLPPSANVAANEIHQHFASALSNSVLNNPCNEEIELTDNVTLFRKKNPEDIGENCLQNENFEYKGCSGSVY